MKSFVFLVVNFALSSAFTQKLGPPAIVDIGEEKRIVDANKGWVHDDILDNPDVQRSSTNNDDRLWPSPVSYLLDSGLELNAKGVTMRALDQFRLKSCIDFKEWDTEEEYYIHVKKLNGCFSYVGMVIRGGQDLSIGRYCDGISTVEHEFLHALGFYHEQSRYDRDEFVTIRFENIVEGFENNFNKVSKDFSTTNGIPYDYMSVMHYGEDFFTNGNGSTIVTKDPFFQEKIGQRLEMSPSDVQELNLRYACNASVAFQMYCGFSDKYNCHMSGCSDSGRGWVKAKYVAAGPTSDHTNLPGGDRAPGSGPSYFMFATTALGLEGDSSWLETRRMTPKRDCNVQCLQFYYYHSGHESDQLNIWIREFEDESDTQGTVRLMGQITGPSKAHWQLKHVSLDSSKLFQIQFEARKGAGTSKGGFSIDDINLSEIECPHVTLQVDNFEEVLNTSRYGTVIRSPRQYSSGGYAYSVGVLLYRTFFGVFVQLLSGDNDDELEWPVPYRQVTFQMVDQNPEIQLQMSKQTSITTDRSLSSAGTFNWGDPQEVGTPDDANGTSYRGPLLGRSFFARSEDLRSVQFLKGGSAVFTYSFQDITSLVNGSSLPCPKIRAAAVKDSGDPHEGGCSTRTTAAPHPRTTHPRTTHPRTTHPRTTHPKTTHPKTTHPKTTHPRTTTTRPPPPPPSPKPTRPRTTPPTTHRPPRTTDEDKVLPTGFTPPTTTDDSIFGFSPRLASFPVLTFLLAVMLLIR